MERSLLRLSLMLFAGMVACTVAYRLIGLLVEADGTLRDGWPGLGDAHLGGVESGHGVAS